MSDRPVLVLFPGAWGNKTEALVAWWFRHVIEYFQHDYEIRLVTYPGETLDAYIQAALTQLKDVPDDSFAICYSMGAQVARTVADTRPTLFRKVALISGLESIGVRVCTLLEGLTFALRPLLRVLKLQPLTLDTVEQVKRVFFHSQKTRLIRNEEKRRRVERYTHLFSREIFDRQLLPEPGHVVLRVAVPGLRRRMPAFPCPVLAVVPRDDFFVRRASYADEDVQRLETGGTHGLIAGNHYHLLPSLQRIKIWFALP